MSSVGLRYELLGPVRLLRKGREINLGSPQQCGVLGLLLLAEGRPLSLEQIVVGLWGDDHPVSASATVRTYLSRLRFDRLVQRHGSLAQHGGADIGSPSALYVELIGGEVGQELAMARGA